jgi:L-rhamnose mutarotase
MCRTSPRHRPHAALLFLHPETRQLFGQAEIDGEEQWASIGVSEICQKWWKQNVEIMLSNPDNTPATVNLREVFNLD